MISNRGVKVWPDGMPETFTTDHWRCRYMTANGSPASHQAIVGLLGRVASAGIDFVKTEHLCTFDGEPGFSKGQGE
jgi:isocitrate dehydrogenase